MWTCKTPFNDREKVPPYRRPDFVTKRCADVDEFVANLDALINVTQLGVDVDGIGTTIIAAAKLDTQGL